MPKPLGEQTTFVYRLYDADDRLLYAGITMSVERRLREHSKQKPWWSRVSRHTVEQYPDRASARAAEWDAIYREIPEDGYGILPGVDITHLATRRDKLNRLKELRRQNRELLNELRRLVQQMFAMGMAEYKISKHISLGTIPSTYQLPALPDGWHLTPEEQKRVLLDAKRIRQEQRRIKGERHSIEMALGEEAQT